MSARLLRTALRSIGHACFRLAGQPRYAMLYDDPFRPGEDVGDRYYGFFGSPDETKDMFIAFGAGMPPRTNVKLALVLDDFPDALPREVPAPGDVIMLGNWVEKVFTPLPPAEAEALREVMEPGCWPADRAFPTAIVVTNADKVGLAIEHLKKARDLFRDAGAKRTLERVRLALSSADGALRHAKLEPYRLERQREFSVGDVKVTQGEIDDALAEAGITVSVVRNGFIYSEETCPSKHWNDGSDICADCGADLQGTPDGKEG